MLKKNQTQKNYMGTDTLSLLQPFFLSFASGMMIGIERERGVDSRSKQIGLRTFVLISLSGTIAAKLNSPMLTLSISLFIFTMLVMSYIRTSEHRTKAQRVGITTEMAGGVVFLLGYLMYDHRLLASTLSVVLFLLLYGRESLHTFAKQKITTKEIEASITLIVIYIAVISFLPDRNIDPWQLINPRKAGFIVLLLACIQFGGYVAIRLFGTRLGMMLTGFFSGLVSSTALFTSMADKQRNKTQISYSSGIACIFAAIASLVANLLITLVLSIDLLWSIFWPVVIAILVGTLMSFSFTKKSKTYHIEIQNENPLHILGVFKLALIILGVLLITMVIQNHLGNKALPYLSFVTGLLSSHGMIYAISSLYLDKSIDLILAQQLLAIVLLANFVSKFFLLGLIARNRFAVLISFALLLMLLAGAIAFFIIPIPVIF